MTKQYLLICDDIGRAILSSAFKENSIQFLEVQGFNLNGENKFNLIATPINTAETDVFEPSQPNVSKIESE